MLCCITVAWAVLRKRMLAALVTRHTGVQFLTVVWISPNSTLSSLQSSKPGQDRRLACCYVFLMLLGPPTLLLISVHPPGLRPSSQAPPSSCLWCTYVSWRSPTSVTHFSSFPSFSQLSIIFTNFPIFRDFSLL